MDALVGLLEARIVVYTLFQKLIGNDPDEQLLDTLFFADTLRILELFDKGDSDLYSDSLKACQASSLFYYSDKVSFHNQAKSEYTRLFIGPEKLIAPPWESAILSKDQLLMQECVIYVKRFYAAEGFQSSKYPQITDDHLAYELDFMRRLSELCGNAHKTEDASEFERLVDRQSAFLELHLLRWIGTYASLMQNSRTKILYPQLANLLSAFLIVDKGLMNELGAKPADLELSIR